MHPKAAILEERYPRVLLAVRRSQHVQLDHGRVFGIYLQYQLHGVAGHAVQNNLLIRRQNHLIDVRVRTAHRLHIARRFDLQLVLILAKSHTTWQRHDLVPAFGRVAGVHVVDDDHAAVAVGRRRRCMNAGWGRCPEVEESSTGNYELVTLHVVVA